jgi:hypothetical protein
MTSQQAIQYDITLPAACEYVKVWILTKGIPRKEERYLDNKTKTLPYTEKRKSVLMMRMRDQWTGGTISDI